MAEDRQRTQGVSWSNMEDFIPEGSWKRWSLKEKGLHVSRQEGAECSLLPPCKPLAEGEKPSDLYGRSFAERQP